MVTLICRWTKLSAKQRKPQISGTNVLHARCRIFLSTTDSMLRILKTSTRLIHYPACTSETKMASAQDQCDDFDFHSSGKG